MTRPFTDTMSPRSVSDFHAASASSPTSASESMTCSCVPLPSCRVAKQSLPVLRWNIMRPATATTSWVSCPGSSLVAPSPSPSGTAWYFARRSCREVDRSTLTG